MSVWAMSEMGKARKSKRTLGRFCLSWEDLCGVGFLGFYLLFWFRVFVSGWLSVWIFWEGEGGLVCFCFVFVIFIYLI